MEDCLTSDDLTQVLVRHFRVLALGGVAVIAHGFGRNTHDADIWVEPMASAEEWAKATGIFLYTGRHHPIAIGSWQPVNQTDLANVIARDGVVRIKGLDRPLDIFRDPNEIDMTSFEEVWARALPLEDGTRLPDAVDLLLSKQDTGRDKDLQDIAFLEAKIEREYLERLPQADEAAARHMLDRFITPKVAEAALSHSSAAVRELGLRFLHELSDEGNPFAAEILRKLQ
jgi:hypothetical protein